MSLSPQNVLRGPQEAAPTLSITDLGVPLHSILVLASFIQQTNLELAIHMGLLLAVPSWLLDNNLLMNILQCV